MSNLHYDPFQFASRPAYPVSAESGIAFSDYGRMHTETHNAAPAAWVPPFALNDKQLQKVLLVRGWRYIGGKGLPAAPDRDKINRAATRKALRGYSIRADASEIQREIVKTHRAAVRKAGGFLQLHAAVAFRSWRLGMQSPEVAQTLDTTPQAVRRCLGRMRGAAKELGFDVGPAGYTAGMKRKRKTKSRA